MFPDHLTTLDLLCRIVQRNALLSLMANYLHPRIQSLNIIILFLEDLLQVIWLFQQFQRSRVQRVSQISREVSKHRHLLYIKENFM